MDYTLWSKDAAMRIAHFVPRYPPALGGSEAYFARLSGDLTRSDSVVPPNVGVYASTPAARARHPGVVYTLGLSHLGERIIWAGSDDGRVLLFDVEDARGLQATVPLGALILGVGARCFLNHLNLPLLPQRYYYGAGVCWARSSTSRASVSSVSGRSKPGASA